LGLIRHVVAAASASASSDDLAASAACRALRLPEIVRAVLAQLHTDVFDAEAIGGDDYGDVDDGDGDDYGALTPVVPALDCRTLLSAALVNRTWCAAAIPLLWREPGARALSDDAVTSPQRRALYASFICTMRVACKATALWRALAPSSSDAGGSVLSGNDNGGMQLPLLTSLHIGRWSDDHNGASTQSGGAFDRVCHDQASIGHLITAKPGRAKLLHDC
jgi:hypothetical protein